MNIYPVLAMLNEYIYTMFDVHSQGSTEIEESANNKALPEMDHCDHGYFEEDRNDGDDDTGKAMYDPWEDRIDLGKLSSDHDSESDWEESVKSNAENDQTRLGTLYSYCM